MRREGLAWTLAVFVIALLAYVLVSIGQGDDIEFAPGIGAGVGAVVGLLISQAWRRRHPRRRPAAVDATTERSDTP